MPYHTPLQSLHWTYPWLLLQPTQTINNTRLWITQTRSYLQHFWILNTWDLSSITQLHWMPPRHLYGKDLWNVLIDLNGIILLEFPRRANTLKSQRRIFYTIISIAKSTLYSFYYKHSGRITESRVCQVFSSHLAKVRIILPDSLRGASNTFKTLILTQPYTSPSTFSSHRKNTTLPESKEKPKTSYALNHTKSRETKTLRHNVITGFFSEDLEERGNSP